MNERQLAILTLLIKNPGYKIGNLEEELNLSRRQINYSLNQFNSLLEENRIPSIKRNKAGDFFIPSEVVQIVSSNESLEISEIDYMSEGERQEIIILYIIISNHYLSLEHMIDLLKVSKTTMIKDIKNASTYVGRFGLKIEYSRELGYEIIGSERNIRILLNELVILWGERLGNSTLLSEYLIKDETPIIEYINIVEEELGINYSSSSFNLLVKLINYTIARITSNRTSTKEFFIDQVKNTEEYKIVNTTIKNEWINNQSDIEWMTLLFLSSNVYKKTLNIFDESFLRNLVVDMIKEFEIKTLIKIENSNEFIDRLYAHLRPAIYRIRYNLSLERYHLNSLLRDPEHIALLSLVKDLVRPLEEQLNKQFPNEELQLLSLYFGSQYITDEKKIKKSKPQAVTVCANGLVTSSILKQTLERLFPEFEFLSAMSEREFYNYEGEYDVVFSTTLLSTKVKQFHVNPLMSNEEQNQLRYNVLKNFQDLYNFEKYQELIEDIIVQVEKYSTIHDKAELTSNLKKIIYSGFGSNSAKYLKGQWNLIDYLNKKFITKTSRKLNWKEAIELSARPLLDMKYISTSYINRLKELIANTEHMYLGNSVAIPHAETEDNVFFDGISILISETPVSFPNNDKVHLVVTLAIKDNTKHLNAMTQLLNLSNNDEEIEKILNMSESQVYDFIEKIEK